MKAIFLIGFGGCALLILGFSAMIGTGVLIAVLNARDELD